MDVSQLQVSIGADISAFEDAISTMVDALDKVADSIQSMANGFTEASSHISASGSDMADKMGSVGGAFLATIGVGVALSTSFRGLADVAGAFNDALAENPIGLVVSIIAALVAIVIECYSKFDTFRAIVNAVWAAIKDLAVMVGDSLVAEFNILYDIAVWVIQVFNDLGNIITTVVVAPIQLLIDAITALYYATAGADWSKAWDAVVQFGTDAKTAASQIVSSVADIDKSTSSMAQNVVRDFSTAAKNIVGTATGMSKDISDAYKTSFETPKAIKESKIAVDKVTLSPKNIQIDSGSSKVNSSGSNLTGGFSLASTSASSVASSSQPVDPNMAMVVDGATNSVTKYTKSLQGLQGQEQNNQKSAQQLANVFDTLATGVGTAIGKMANGGKDAASGLKDMLKSFVDSLAEFVIKKGEALTFAGSSAEVASGGTDPQGWLQIAEGTALITAASAVKAIKMASGGIVSGSTFANVGEYAGASHNPEVVAPLDKLRGMMGGQSNTHYSFELMGDKMVTAMQRQSSNNNFVLGTNNQ